MTSPPPSPTNLWEYYTGRGTSLPTIADRSKFYAAYGFGTADSYVGTAEQNTALLGALLASGGKPPGANAPVTRDIRGFHYTSPLTDADWSWVLDAFRWYYGEGMCTNCGYRRDLDAGLLLADTAYVYAACAARQQYEAEQNAQLMADAFASPTKALWHLGSNGAATWSSPTYRVDTATGSWQILGVTAADLNAAGEMAGRLAGQGAKAFTEGAAVEAAKVLKEQYLKPNLPNGTYEYLERYESITKLASNIAETLKNYVEGLLRELTWAMGDFSWDGEATYDLEGQEARLQNLAAPVVELEIAQLGSAGELIAMAMAHARMLFQHSDIQFQIQDTTTTPIYVAPAGHRVAVWTASGGDTVAGGASGDVLLGQKGQDSLAGGGGDDVLGGMAGNDFLLGQGGNDILAGHSGNDLLDGGEGDDWLCGGPGHDTLDGGAGLDMAVYSGRHASYAITAAGSGRNVVGPEGTDTLSGVERLDFSDAHMGFDVSGNTGQIYRLYKAAFARVPDLGGLGGWIAGMDNGLTLQQVANSFLASTEFQSLYGANSSNGQFVTALYLNVMGRAPDAGGYGYWVNQLASNLQTRAQVLVAFSESGENRNATASLTANGILYTSAEQAAGPARGQNFNGTAGLESLFGSVGNDTFNGGGSNDNINGGAGLDLAAYGGNRSTHTVTRTANGLTVSGGSDGTDTLVNVERLKFADIGLAFDINGNAGQMYRLYQAAFDRTPDTAGLSDWIRGMDNGMSLQRVATGFIGSGEFQSLYGAHPSDKQFVNLLYNNVLNRTPDTAGYDYWLGQMAGGMTRELVLIGFSESAENQAAVLPAIQGGIVYVV